MIVLPLVLKQLQQWDQRRSGVPGEHWATFGTGLALLGMARPGRSPLLRAVAGAAGVALVWRAASGRDGFLQAVRSNRAAPPEQLRLPSP